MRKNHLFDHDSSETFRSVERAEGGAPAAVFTGLDRPADTAEIHAPDVAHILFGRGHGGNGEFDFRTPVAHVRSPLPGIDLIILKFVVCFASSIRLDIMLF